MQNTCHTHLFIYAFMRVYGLELFESKLKIPQKTVFLNHPHYFSYEQWHFCALKHFVLIPWEPPCSSLCHLPDRPWALITLKEIFTYNHRDFYPLVFLLCIIFHQSNYMNLIKLTLSPGEDCSRWKPNYSSTKRPCYPCTVPVSWPSKSWAQWGRGGGCETTVGTIFV